MGVLTTDPIHTRTNFDCTSLSSKTVKYFNSYTIKNNPVLIQRLSNLNSKNKKAQSLDQLVPTSATNSEINQLVIVGESVFKKEKKYVESLLAKQSLINRKNSTIVDYSQRKHFELVLCEKEIANMPWTMMHEGDEIDPKIQILL